MGYTKRQRVRIARALERRQRRILNDIREAAQTQGRGQRLLDVADLGDASVAAVLADLSAAEFHRDIEELRALIAAKNAMKDESFGQCVECGQEFGAERLVAEPAATRCVLCQERREKLFGAAA